MKNLKFIILAGASLFLVSCSQHADVKTLLANQNSKNEVFEAIVNDHELMTEFMGKMMESKHAMMMMQDNQGMMKNMMGEGGMMGMMKNNPDMMHSTMSGMMKDGKMMGSMMKMMHEKGMMSEECMQSCMEMMDK